MAYCGIDYSMSCPSLCVSKKSKIHIDDCEFFFYNNTKKFNKDFGNVHGFLHLPYESQEERFENIAEWAIKILTKFKVTDVCLEGYAMGAKGQVFNIGENTGILKNKLWKNNISIITPSPGQIKKFFTGSGNAKKEIMYKSFIEETELDLEKLLDAKSGGNPISDIVDSYAMCKYGLNEKGFK